MWRWPNLIGVALGLVGGLAILGLIRSPEKRVPPSGPILSECDGHFADLVVHYEPAAKEIVTRVYRDLLRQLDPDVTVHVVCQDRGTFAAFESAFPARRCRILPIYARHPITTWSRDRWVALAPAGPGQPTTVWSPRAEAADEIWSARAGDELVGRDVGTALAPEVFWRRSPFYFDGGDFLSDNETVFVVPRVLGRNVQHTAANREEFLRILQAELKRRVVLLAESPDHHAGMFMASVGERRMLVGDPSLGKEFVPPLDAPSAAEWMALPGGADFTPETQRLFDAVAAQCAAAGYEVTRIPLVLATDGRTYLTYANVLLDDQEVRHIVYLPFYQGAESLNEAARAVWENLGYQVRPVDCTDTYRHFGCLHCLVNVLKRTHPS